jgi:hypothetical protein
MSPTLAVAVGAADAVLAAAACGGPEGRARR